MGNDGKVLKVLGDMVCGFIPLTNEVKTKSGIVLSSKSNVVHVEATVASKGPDCTLDIKDGDRIIYNVAYATEVDYGDPDNKMILVPQKYVYAVIEQPTRNKVTFENHDQTAIEVISKTLANQLVK